MPRSLASAPTDAVTVTARSSTTRPGNTSSTIARIGQEEKLTRRRSECLIDRPSPSDTSIYGKVREIKMIAGVHEAHLNSIDNHSYIAASISGLFARKHPLAIFLVISKRIIRAVNGMLSCWLTSHVGKEFDKVVPSITDGYASSSVMRESYRIRILTSFKHGFPASIFWRASSRWNTPSMSMNRKPFARLFSLQAPTTLRLSALQTSTKDSGGISTRAFTQPSPPFAWSFSFHRNNEKSSKYRASSIYNSMHNEKVPNLRILVNMCPHRPKGPGRG